MTSATLTSDVQRLKQMLCNNPVVLKLLEPDLPDASQLSQVVTLYLGIFLIVQIYYLSFKQCFYLTCQSQEGRRIKT